MLNGVANLGIWLVTQPNILGCIAIAAESFPLMISFLPTSEYLKRYEVNLISIILIIYVFQISKIRANGDRLLGLNMARWH